MQNREKFGSRLGFILISAGCAIGLGNVWRFPYIVAENGGAAFILIYLVFLLAMGIPAMSMEFAVGRGSRKSIVGSFSALEPKGSKWHLFSGVGIVGNYMLMMFYTVVTGWMLLYIFKTMRGDFAGLDSAGVSAAFKAMQANPIPQFIAMFLMVLTGFGICSIGLQKGVERITKVMMILLIAIMLVLAVRSVTLPGAGEGLRYYLVPDFSKIFGHGFNHLNNVLFTAMGQAFFTLSIGMGSMAIFGSYIDRDRSLAGESLSITILDTTVAFSAGLIIIPACFAYDVPLNAGPSLIFETLPNIFNAMPMGRLWGSLFFVFMLFAALSTLIGVFENIISISMDGLGWSRKKASIVGIISITILSLPALLGYNLLSDVHLLGGNSTILDFEDFIVSQNVLPIGALVYVLFCTCKWGWGWKNFEAEVNAGKGLKISPKLRGYITWVLPVIIIYVFIMGYIGIFG